MRLINGFFAFTTLWAIAGLMTGPRQFLEPTGIWLAVLVWHVIWFIATRKDIPLGEQIDITSTLLVVCIPVSILTGVFLTAPVSALTPWILAIILAVDVVFCLKMIGKSLPLSLRAMPGPSVITSQAVSLGENAESMQSMSALGCDQS